MSRIYEIHKEIDALTHEEASIQEAENNYNKAVHALKVYVDWVGQHGVPNHCSELALKTLIELGECEEFKE